MVINIDNHLTSCGCYNRFLKWQDELSKQEEPLPEGLLFLAFDNEQKGQKNYLDRGFNMTISGIKNGIRKWVAVTCDGVPYRYITKLKDEFPWLVLVPGQLYEEMNMLCAFVKLNW
ncbi:hypothetical protein C2G38_2154455 [Gigaspora rosea]|uniref:Uncharacterized protein n=1 Tax=Gigaspora rosea TaxID=44941 RepID=A0A397W897_9GLOM|nr:hypothetical protein C2G38_2154455 [Gigaspora rosea]